MSDYVIFDIDNCLANDRDRIALIDWTKDNPEERYAAYHAAAPFDTPWNSAVFNREVNGHLRIPIFLTARPVTLRKETEQWLLDNFFKSPLVGEQILIMRNENDHRPSLVVKAQMLLWLQDLYEIQPSMIKAAYDDRPDIIEMYRSVGIPAEVLAIHDVCAYTPPPKAAPARRAPDMLDAGAATFRERNATYGDTYLDFGKAAAALFPNGLALKTVDDFNRMGIFTQCLGKLARYAANLSEGGHQDSAHDLMVYAAMLEEVTK